MIQENKGVKEKIHMKIDAVIFDVDGTLWDSTDVVASAWNQATKEAGVEREPLTGDILKTVFGKPMNKIADELFPDATQEARDMILKTCCHYEHEALLNYKGSLLFPGVKELFEELSKKCKVYVVSNCQSGYIELFLKLNGMEEYVTDTECYGDTLLSKGQNIKLIMERNQIQNTFYVGDTIGDFNATKEAEVPFVFAKYGFGKVEGAWQEIDDIREVLNLI